MRYFSWLGLIIAALAATFFAPNTYYLYILGIVATTAGIKVIAIEHDMNLVMEISDRVVVLDRGKVICSGTPAQVRKTYIYPTNRDGQSALRSILSSRR
ncbi:MAG: hypothetical protein AB4206_00340 [Xenococcaceae cyanobacterium]